MQDIRCLDKGQGTTTACPMPDLACWRWGLALGMAFPHVLGKEPLGQGSRFCHACQLLSAAQCNRGAQWDAGRLQRSHPGRESSQ